MHNEFKALATITAWTLMVIGWISLIAGYFHLVVIYFSIDLYTLPPESPPVWMPLIGGFLCLTLSVIVMRLRQAMA